MKLEFLAAAKQDLEGIYDYIAADSIERAGRFIDRIQFKCRSLTATPWIGRDRPDLAPGLRSLSYSRYLIIYRVRDDAVQIVGVIHGMRDLPAIFDRDEDQED